jgi:hypothetical protein
MHNPYATNSTKVLRSSLPRLIFCTTAVTNAWFISITYDRLGNYISGAIMFEETLYQKAANGQQFVDLLLVRLSYCWTTQRI